MFLDLTLGSDTSTHMQADLASLAKRLKDWIPAVSKSLVVRGVGLVYTRFPL